MVDYIPCHGDFMLQLYNFIDVKQETFKHGREENLLVDTESRACESLYVEALRP
jgi:hypothetical protein